MSVKRNVTVPVGSPSGESMSRVSHRRDPPATADPRGHPAQTGGGRLHGPRAVEETIGDVESCDGRPAGRAHAGSRHDRGISRGLPESPVAPVASRASVRQALGELPDDPTRLDQVIDELIQAASPGLMASAGPRYYGFLIGGSLDGASGRCDHFRLGSERVQRGAVAGRDRLRGCRGKLDQGADLLRGLHAGKSPPNHPAAQRDGSPRVSISKSLA